MTVGTRDRQLVSPHQVVAAGLCIGCGSCVAQSDDLDAAMKWDRFGQLKPSGKDWFHVASERFNRTCPFAPDCENEDELAARFFPATRRYDGSVGRFEGAYVGHVVEDDFRAKGSSGGMVTWVAAELLRRKLVDGVAHVLPVPDARAEGRMFRYRISRSVADIRLGSCSRYYPIDLSDILRTIGTTPGRYAVIGVPCFIKAVNLLKTENPIFRERVVYTLGLFCGHMKSAGFVDSLALQMGVDRMGISAVDYRTKAPDRPANCYRARLTLADGSVHEKDWWHLVDGDWGAGFFQNYACNFCDDVVAETADIAFGDAWVEPYASDPGGSNVIVARTVELRAMVTNAAREGRLSLREVDANFIKETQAAGLRQRREGLSYRLARLPPSLPLRKRVSPESIGVSRRRRLIYRTRYRIASWSHRMFATARALRLPTLYVWWAGAALRMYQGLTYSRGKIGRACDMLLNKKPLA